MSSFVMPHWKKIGVRIGKKGNDHDQAINPGERLAPSCKLRSFRLSHLSVITSFIFYNKVAPVLLRKHIRDVVRFFGLFVTSLYFPQYF
jgi:hypothetical protein